MLKYGITYIPLFLVEFMEHWAIWVRLVTNVATEKLINPKTTRLIYGDPMKTLCEP